jgi:hypothetical protein
MANARYSAMSDVSHGMSREQGQDVAERVHHDGYPADRNVRRPGHYPAADGPDSGGCVIRGGHEPVRLIPVPGRQGDLGAAAGQ